MFEKVIQMSEHEVFGFWVLIGDLEQLAPTRIFRRVPLTQRPEDYSQFVGNVEVLDMMNDLNQIVSWAEKNHPDGERCSDLREMCRRLLKRLDRIDPSV